MKATIRLRLFLMMGSLIAMFMIFSWFMNTQWLDRFYFFYKKNTLIENYHQINALYRSSLPDIELELEKLEHSQGMLLMVVDRDLNLVYNVFAKEHRPLPPPPQSPDRPRSFQESFNRMLQSKMKQVHPGETLIEVDRDTRLMADFINLFAFLDNGYFVILRTPMAALQESVAIANRFFLFTGVLTLVIGSFMVFLLANRFTKPILELKRIARQMARLDFTQKYLGKERDELGELGQSINSLSEQLEASISQLTKANRQLQQDIERERKIDEMRKEFVSNVSHELKTPIALIQGYAEGLKVNVIEDEAGKNFYCDVIIDETAKMNRLVKQLLNLARLESGIPLERTIFNFSDLLESVLRRNTLLFKEKNIRVRTEIEDRLMVNGDPELLEQVINNYLGNALNHLDAQKVIHIRVWRMGAKVRVSVYNSGHLIPPESMDKIWTSFYKVDKARTREYGGTGLGLSIVRAIQEAHGNGYGVQNECHGVTFWFDLDAVDDENMLH